MMNAKRTQKREIPVLPLRDVVVFPYMVMPLFVGRDKSIRSLDHAMETGKQLLLVAQKQAEVEDPTVADLYDIGTIVNIIQMLKLPDGTVKVLVEGQQRADILRMSDDDHFSAVIEPIETIIEANKELEVARKVAFDEFENYV